jgi:hypothetical protein
MTSAAGLVSHRSDRDIAISTESDGIGRESVLGERCHHRPLQPRDLKVEVRTTAPGSTMHEKDGAARRRRPSRPHRHRVTVGLNRESLRGRRRWLLGLAPFGSHRRNGCHTGNEQAECGNVSAHAVQPGPIMRGYKISAKLEIAGNLSLPGWATLPGLTLSTASRPAARAAVSSATHQR